MDLKDEKLNPKAVSDYYGEVLEGSDDLITDACSCGDEDLTPSVKAALARVNDDVITRFYGCGSPLPPALEGCTVLDLGCGTGRDVYVASQLVGERGHVIGVDMTRKQLEVARRNVDDHMSRFAYETPNVEFRHGTIEDLAAAGVADHSVDVVISNCVINLSNHKEKVFEEIFRVLKPGGELYFSDVFASRRVPEALKEDPVLHGECLAGALYEEDFRRLLTSLGCPDARQTTRRRLAVADPKVRAKLGAIDFDSVTVRAFKLRMLEDRCEDYGQVATYLGTLEDAPHAFELDPGHLFETGRPERVCGNTASMLQETRYANHFEVRGDRERHFGLFPCGHELKLEGPAPGGCC